MGGVIGFSFFGGKSGISEEYVNPQHEEEDQGEEGDIEDEDSKEGGHIDNNDWLYKIAEASGKVNRLYYSINETMFLE